MQLSIDWSFLIAVIALAISTYTLWDNQFRFKFGAAAAKQIRLHVAKVDRNRSEPCIYLNMALLNFGGRTGYLKDIKLNVRLESEGNTFLNESFESIREFDSFLKGAENVIQSEIRPIGLIGKTVEHRSYVFLPKIHINQNQIPENFDLYITIISKQRTNWLPGKKYVSKNISHVWQDLNSDNPENYSTRDIEEID